MTRLAEDRPMPFRRARGRRAPCPAAPALAAGAALLLAAPAGAQFLDLRLDRVGLERNPRAGSMRLDAMGGLLVVGRDENNQISLWDWDGNVAGLVEDRDVTSAELWYSNLNHLVPAVGGVRDDLHLNRGGVLGVYRGGANAVGVAWNYAEISAKDETRIPRRMKRSEFEGLYSARIGSRVLAGLRAGVATETERNRTAEIYRLTHDAVGGGGGGAIAVRILPELTVAARGDFRHESVDGRSTSVFHTDEFTWDRPSKEGALSAFVDLGPRLEGAASVSRSTLEGREDVILSWSAKFFFNPTPDVFREERPALSEDGTTTTARTRWSSRPIPDLELGASVDRAKTDYTVETVPNVFGSLGAEDRTRTDTRLAGGAGYTFLRNRAFAGTEVRRETSEITSRLGAAAGTEERTRTAFHAGGEWLVSPALATRIGYAYRTDETDAGGPDLASSFLTAGIGVLLRGGVIELNATYARVLDSDVDLDQNTASAYARLLF
jgi:hypothetical protein